MITEEQRAKVSKHITELGLRYIDVCYLCFKEKTEHKIDDKLFFVGQITSIPDFCELALGCDKKDTKLLTEYAEQIARKIMFYGMDD